MNGLLHPPPFLMVSFDAQLQKFEWMPAAPLMSINVYTPIKWRIVGCQSLHIGHQFAGIGCPIKIEEEEEGKGKEVWKMGMKMEGMNKEGGEDEATEKKRIAGQRKGGNEWRRGTMIRRILRHLKRR